MCDGLPQVSIQIIIEDQGEFSADDPSTYQQVAVVKMDEDDEPKLLRAFKRGIERPASEEAQALVYESLVEAVCMYLLSEVEEE